MSKALSILDSTALANARRTDHPVAVYLASLSAGSRRTMLGALNTIAAMAGGERVDAQSFPWHQLHHEHTAAIRSALAERYSPSTANKMLAAMRGVLKACWRLGLMDVISISASCRSRPAGPTSRRR